MFVKQIDKKTALELAAKGKKVLVMIPGGKDSGWEDMTPDSLEHMLEGCMFFRKEPAMEAELMELTVELCPFCHRDNQEGVHGNREKMDALHRIGQAAFERDHTREEFRRIFGKNYL